MLCYNHYVKTELLSFHKSMLNYIDTVAILCVGYFHSIATLRSYLATIA